jgi:hypothetical protein
MELRLVIGFFGFFNTQLVTTLYRSRLTELFPLKFARTEQKTSFQTALLMLCHMTITITAESTFQQLFCCWMHVCFSNTLAASIVYRAIAYQGLLRSCLFCGHCSATAAYVSISHI